MKDTLLLSPFALLLFILPFLGTLALRLLCLAVAFVIELFSWLRLEPSSLPCKAAIGIWAVLALASLATAIDPDYSSGEIKNEIDYPMAAYLDFITLTRTREDAKLFI